jgi:hypothetical protein
MGVVECEVGGKRFEFGGFDTAGPRARIENSVVQVECRLTGKDGLAKEAVAEQNFVAFGLGEHNHHQRRKQFAARHAPLRQLGTRPSQATSVSGLCSSAMSINSPKEYVLDESIANGHPRMPFALSWMGRAERGIPNGNEENRSTNRAI